MPDENLTRGWFDTISPTCFIPSSKYPGLSAVTSLILRPRRILSGSMTRGVPMTGRPFRSIVHLTGLPDRARFICDIDHPDPTRRVREHEIVVTRHYREATRKLR